MADDKSNVGADDRRQVAAGQDYEVRHFAEKHNLTVQQVQALIQTHGNDREKLDRAAERLNG